MLIRPMMMRLPLAGAAGSTFNPTDKAAQIDLSADLLTATDTDSSATFYGVRGTKSRNSGKLYAEFVNNAVSGNTGLNEYGLASSDYALNDAFYDNSSIFWYNGPNGQIYQGSTKNGDASGNLAKGDVLGVAWDVSAGTVVFYRNGSAVYQVQSYNPAKPMFLFFAGNRGGSAQLRTTVAQFTQPIPSGFSPWG